MATLTDEEKVRQIKRVTMERAYPMFSNTDILNTLRDYNGDVRATIYKLLTIKAQTGAISLQGVTVPDMSRYFLNLALEYRPNNSGGR